MAYPKHAPVGALSSILLNLSKFVLNIALTWLAQYLFKDKTEKVIFAARSAGPVFANSICVLRQAGSQTVTYLLRDVIKKC